MTVTGREVSARLAATLCATTVVLLATGIPTGLLTLPAVYCSTSVTEAIMWAPLNRRPIRLYARWAPEAITLLAILHLHRLITR